MDTKNVKKNDVVEILKASYLNPKGAKKRLQDLGYTYDTQLSNNENKVFVDKYGNPNIAYRGTKPSKLKDLKSDIMLAIGLQKYDTRFKEAQKLKKLVENKYEKPINIFGHSLGGTLSEFVKGKDDRVFTYNKGVGVGDIGKTVSKNQTDYRNENDAISILSKTQKYKHENLKEQQLKNINPLDILKNHAIV